MLELRLEHLGGKGAKAGNEEGHGGRVARGYQEQAEENVIGPQPQCDKKGLGAAYESVRTSKPG